MFVDINEAAVIVRNPNDNGRLQTVKLLHVFLFIHWMVCITYR